MTLQQIGDLVSITYTIDNELLKRADFLSFEMPDGSVKRYVLEKADAMCWIKLNRDEDVYDLKGAHTWAQNYRCSNCGFIATFIENHGLYDFCPHCGGRLL